MADSSTGRQKRFVIVATKNGLKKHRIFSPIASPEACSLARFRQSKSTFAFVLMASSAVHGAGAATGGVLSLRPTTLQLSEPRPHVLQVCLHRPQQLNAMNKAFWAEFREVFEAANADSHFRVAVVTASGRHFTAGLDLAELASASSASSSFDDDDDGDDVDDDDDDSDGGTASDIGRTAVHLREHVLKYQGTFVAMEQARIPTIVAVHGACIGGGVDLCCSACIRYTCAGSYICIQEVNVGLAADVGTLQKIPKLGVSMSVVNDWAYTARYVMLSLIHI